MLVIGDVMLDQYFSGEVSRISLEDPVPVNHIQTIQEWLEGAANVAHNLAALGCQVKLIGAIGDDLSGTTRSYRWDICLFT